jgi:hypothetical protein
VIAGLRLERARETAFAAAQSLLAAVDGQDASLAALAEQRGLEVISAQRVDRRAENPDPAVVDAVFRLPVEADDLPVRTVVEAQNGYALVVLEEVADGELSEVASGLRQQYRRQIANAEASTEALGMLEQLRANADIETFEGRLQ